HDRRDAMLLDHAEPADLPRGGVGGLEVIGAASGADRVPEAVADGVGDVVLAEPRAVSPCEPRRIARLEGVEVGFRLGVKLFARHGLTSSTILPTCSPASMRACAAAASASGKIRSTSG